MLKQKHNFAIGFKGCVLAPLLYSKHRSLSQTKAPSLHYPFGSSMVGYKNEEFSYSYSFNGMEKDDEVKGGGNSLDFGARIYDSRLGSWLSRDPLEKKFPGISTYAFCFNNPILFIVPSGMVPMTPTESKIIISAFVQAIRLYAVNEGQANFLENFAAHTHTYDWVTPSNVNVAIKGIRSYDGSYNRILGSNELTTDMDLVSGENTETSNITFFNKDTQKKNTIASVKFNGLVTGGGSGARFQVQFLNSSSAQVGTIEFKNNTKGKKAYKALEKAYNIIAEASYYEMAIKYDKENNIPYNSSNSLQKYLDVNFPNYKKSHETKVELKVSDNKVTIKIGDEKVKAKTK